MDATGTQYLDIDTDGTADGFDCVDDGCCEGPTTDESSTLTNGSVSNFDADGDGQTDQTAFDTTGDGVADTWNIDTNGDLVADQVALDTTGDGVADTWHIDSNQDGVAESTQFDSTGDGIPESGAPADQLPQDPYAETPAPEPSSESEFNSGDETLDKILERASRTTDPAERERLLEFAETYSNATLNMSRVWL